MKRLMTVMVLALGLAGCSSLDTVGSWVGMGGSNAPKPSELMSVTPSLEVTRAWEAQIGVSGAYPFAPDSDGEGIYAASASGRLARFTPSNGKIVWQVETTKPLSAGVSAADGLVVAGTAKGEILAWHAKNGQLAWEVTLSGEILARPLVYGGAVFVRSGDGRVYKLDAHTGKTLWVYSRNLPALLLREAGGVSADAQAVYVGHAGGKLTALAQANGAPLWEANVAVPRGATELERIADVVGTPALDGRLVCAAAYQGRVACFERTNGQLVWSRDFSAQRGVAMDGENVYAVDSDSIVQAFQRERGVSPWKQDKLKLRGLGAPVSLNENTVVLGDYEGVMHLLRRTDGAFAARVMTDGSAVRGEVVALKQGFIVQTANGGVYAFRLGR